MTRKGSCQTGKQQTACGVGENIYFKLLIRNAVSDDFMTEVVCVYGPLDRPKREDSQIVDGGQFLL